MSIENFFADDYVDFASYDNLRKIGSCIDGLKNTSRKIVYTVKKNNIVSGIKVSQLDSKMAEQTQYLHGSGAGVIVTLAADYCGANNYPLLAPLGSFGTRHTPAAAAARYIYTAKSSNFDSFIPPKYDNVLIEQIFEGDKIEPRFFLPSLPLILLNGSRGVSPGFAQLILPRSISDVKRAVRRAVKGQSSLRVLPEYEGFKGKTEIIDGGKAYVFEGIAERVNTTTVRITELPIGYSLKSYEAVLIALQQNKHITSYKDLSDDDDFEFVVKFARAKLSKLSEVQLLTKLKLRKRVTENFTCIDANNKIRVFDNETDLIEYFVAVKLEFVHKWKVIELARLTVQAEIANDRSRFIDECRNGVIDIYRPSKNVEVRLADLGFKKQNKSYDHLLRMAVRSLTEDNAKKLRKAVLDIEDELIVLKSKSASDIMLEDISRSL